MVTGVEPLGLVVVADAPMHPAAAPEYCERVRLVSGAVPRLRQIPWAEPWSRGAVEPWRLGEPYLFDAYVSPVRDLSRLFQTAE